MPRIMWKNFYHCFPSNLTKPSSPSDIAAASDDPNRPSILFINNFNLLYDNSSSTRRRLSKHLMEIVPTSSTTTTTCTASTSTANSSSTSYDDKEDYVFTPEDDNSLPPDLTAVYASRRFFFSSPGRSNSITDSPDLRPTTATTTSSLLSGGAAVKQYVQSPDPYNDFRRSMQEMLDARDSLDAGDPRRYEFLHELLRSYLSLNAKDTHKFIIRAFADILVSLLSDGHHRAC